MTDFSCFKLLNKQKMQGNRHELMTLEDFLRGAADIGPLPAGPLPAGTLQKGPLPAGREDVSLLPRVTGVTGPAPPRRGGTW